MSAEPVNLLISTCKTISMHTIILLTQPPTITPAADGILIFFFFFFFFFLYFSENIRIENLADDSHEMSSLIFSQTLHDTSYCRVTKHVEISVFDV